MADLARLERFDGYVEFDGCVGWTGAGYTAIAGGRQGLLGVWEPKAAAGASGTGCRAGVTGALPEPGAKVSGSGLGMLPEFPSVLVRTFKARIEFMITSRWLR